MTALLDTVTFLRWITGSHRKLPRRVLRLLGDNRNTFYVSPVSAMEIMVKARVGGPEALELRIQEPIDEYIDRQITEHQFARLDITIEHALRVYSMQWHHDDPADVLLIAQCLVEGIPIISSDQKMPQYPLPVIWD